MAWIELNAPFQMQTPTRTNAPVIVPSIAIRNPSFIAIPAIKESTAVIGRTIQLLCWKNIRNALVKQIPIWAAFPRFSVSRRLIKVSV